MKRFAVLLIAASSLIGVMKVSAQVAVGLQVDIAPPAIPVYVQPPCPVEGYFWTPGYWAYGPNGYYWVPGVWLAPPQIGFLWTPGYWGWETGRYFWHGGYWGPHVGFYGGVNYGFGYGGHGFYGGRWDGGAFRYNAAVWHVGGGFHNTYSERPAVGPGASHASYAGGPGGIEAKPTPEEESAMHENHVQPTSQQMSHEHSASMSHSQLASVNHGNPATAARSTVGGQRYNSSGHTMSVAHSAHNAGVAHNGGQQMQHNAGVSHQSMQHVNQGAGAQHQQMQQHANGGGHQQMHSNGGGGHAHGGGRR